MKYKKTAATFLIIFLVFKANMVEASEGQRQETETSSFSGRAVARALLTLLMMQQALGKTAAECEMLRQNCREMKNDVDCVGILNFRTGPFDSSPNHAYCLTEDFSDGNGRSSVPVENCFVPTEEFQGIRIFLLRCSSLVGGEHEEDCRPYLTESGKYREQQQARHNYDQRPRRNQRRFSQRRRSGRSSAF